MSQFTIRPQKKLGTKHPENSKEINIFGVVQTKEDKTEQSYNRLWVHQKLANREYISVCYAQVIALNITLQKDLNQLLKKLLMMWIQQNGLGDYLVSIFGQL